VAALVPAGVVTRMSTVPAGPAGTVAVIWVFDTDTFVPRAKG
jgi:hypothetical protein